jgi:hypothetical protein
MKNTGYMLTKRQRFVLEFIEAYKRKWGVVPTYRVIAIGCKVKSCGGTYRLVHDLSTKGYISKNRGRYDVVVQAGVDELSTDSGQGVGGGQEEDQGFAGDGQGTEVPGELLVLCQADVAGVYLGEASSDHG